jgi:hypothetical protein
LRFPEEGTLPLESHGFPVQGVPIIIAIVSGILFFVRRRRRLNSLDPRIVSNQKGVLYPLNTILLLFFTALSTDILLSSLSRFIMNQIHMSKEKLKR